MPELYIVAGPNGSGKSTFAQEFLPKFTSCRLFINADLIALGLSPFDPVRVRLKAGRLLLSQIKEYIANKENFAFESTLSGKTYATLINEAKKQGYTIHIFFLWTPEVRLAKARIAQRVKNGGHDVPKKDIERRFTRSRINFRKIYRNMANTWVVYDNSSEKPKELAHYNTKELKVLDHKLFETFEECDDH